MSGESSAEALAAFLSWRAGPAEEAGAPVPGAAGRVSKAAALALLMCLVLAALSLAAAVDGHLGGGWRLGRHLLLFCHLG